MLHINFFDLIFYRFQFLAYLLFTNVDFLQGFRLELQFAFDVLIKILLDECLSLCFH